MNKNANILSLCVHETIFVSDEVLIETIIIRFIAQTNLRFTAQEIAGLREALRASVGNKADELDHESLVEFGTSVLYATATVLKARFAQKKISHEKNEK